MNHFFTALILISLFCIFIFIIQVLINIIKKGPVKKSVIRIGISAIIFIISFIGFGMTMNTSSNENNSDLATSDLSLENTETNSIDENDNPNSEILSLENSEPVPEEADSQGVTKLFEEVYLPYANRKKSFEYNSVKQFAQSSNYELEITEPSSEESGSITLTAENGDYVYFGFKSIDNINVVRTVSYFQTSSNSEVSLNNYSSYNSSEYDIYNTHVLGSPNSKVSDTQEQQAFLFD